MGNLSLRLRLPLLVAGTMLPLILFAAGVILFNHERERAAAFDHLLETTRGMRVALDAEMQGITLALEILAGSQALQRDDLEGFRRNVEMFLARFPKGDANIALFDAAGRQVFLSNRSISESELPRGNPEAHDAVMQTGRPYYSNLFTGAASHRHIVAVSVPVIRDGQTVYELSFNPPFDTFQDIIERQRPGADWTISIFDRNGVNFARVPNPQTMIGERASPSLYAELFKAPEAKLPTVSLEGVPLLTAYSRSLETGWTVAGGISAATISAPLWHNLIVTATIGAGMLLIGLGFALGMARQIAQGEALQRLLVNEMNHRVKNILATVQSIAVQTFRESGSPAEAKAKFEGRLIALGHAHDALSDEKWKAARLWEIVENVLEPYGATDRERLHLSGPEISVAPRTALMLSMVLHELATNAAKYGALSNDAGEIFISWTPDKSDGFNAVRLIWKERGGPPVQPASRKGFGSQLIQDGFAGQLGGSATLDWQPAGLTCTLRCPLG
jgi:two-component sensor histidine kinase